MTFGVAEATIALVGDNRACSDGENREDECSDSERIGVKGRSSSKKGSFCNRGGPG